MKTQFHGIRLKRGRVVRVPGSAEPLLQVGDFFLRVAKIDVLCKKNAAVASVIKCHTAIALGVLPPNSGALGAARGPATSAGRTEGAEEAAQG